MSPSDQSASTAAAPAAARTASSASACAWASAKTATRPGAGPRSIAMAAIMPDMERPEYATPMKAVLTADRPAGEEWVFERKLDGIRCLAVKDGGRTRLYSRNELSLNERYAPIAAALDADDADGFVIDGEAVSFVDGRDRFGAEGGSASTTSSTCCSRPAATSASSRWRSGGRCWRACSIGRTRCARPSR